jgi:hypothetical protein
VKKELLDLIASGKIEKLIEKLSTILSNGDNEDAQRSVTLLSARYNRNKRANMMGTIRDANYNIELNKISFALEDLISNEFDDSDPVKNATGDNPSTKKSVFISYSHRESEHALKLKESLENQGVDVIIDVKDLVAGADIRTFINESIKQASNTISIISMNSLLSSWVSIEVIKTINSEQISNKNFIAAFIDDAFFKRDYPDQALDSIEKELVDIKEAIRGRLDKGRKYDDLQSELIRYEDLKYYFPKIIKRLNDSLSVDIRDDQFEAGVTAIHTALK